MFDPDDPAERPKVEMAECGMCHRQVPISELMTMSGRRLCFGCASSWYEDDDEESE